MKKSFTIAVCLLMAVAACSSFQEEPGNMECAKKTTNEVFYATLEQSGAADATKVYADENLKVLWNADDRITIFNRYTYGYEYAFQGATGKTAGTFAKVDEGTEFVTGNALYEIYAVYPHSSENDIDNAGNLTITWPSPQTYKPDSFGIGANVMVSVTDDNQLRFRNVGGYLALKLYGDNVSVSSITLRGNNGEKLSGRATITCATDAEPALTFQSASSESLRLECPTPVPIGSTAETATTFWLVVPPTQFTQGFNITVRTSNGLVFYKSTDIAYEIERNTLCRMAAIEVIPSDIVPFADANFKAYCIANFDTDSDGEISLSEALAVTTIYVCTDNIESLQGIEFFTNLTVLSARGSAAYYKCVGGGGYLYGDSSILPDPVEGVSVASGKLSEINLSGLPKLRTVDISGNDCVTAFYPGSNPLLGAITCGFCNITEIDLSDNDSLTWLDCGGNQLTALNVSNNTALIYLDCRGNQLTALDISNNTALTYLYCDNNQLTALDVSNKTALLSLDCYNNQLTALDVSNNNALTYLRCESNQLTALNVLNNTALIYLYCGGNQLTALNVLNNTALINLYCGSNQLTALDVSNNTALTGLHCYNNQLTALDVSNNTALTDLDCHDNQLTALDVSNNSALTYLSCGGNQLTALNVLNNTALIYLYCSGNQLTALDVSTNTALTDLYCFDNQLTALDISNNTALTDLYCSENQLTALDVSYNTELKYLGCFNNPYLTSLWLKTGQTIPAFDYDTNVAQIQYKD